ncbi:MAG: Asp-tRNA(Asn)/Glu-tRNA(Gln) amidotransferase GatCAB subunit A, partial [Deltaproteobacteria bacterium]|nr:Asp-tRNA(Asn)/Glu-tRNA(Gln) amidotransferase GatCAB subunit A [Deltaproteobacteria bacterium]
MKTLNLEELTISELSPQIKRRRISPVEIISQYLERIKKLNPLLNAYSTVTEEQAIADAEVAEREIKRGKYRGPLHAIPFSIKDNLATKGIRTTAGSKILAEWQPDFDATVVARLKAAGAIILGKTNMHEWASGGTTINPYFGTTYNPWDRKRIPGGSSGGSAAAVAADMCLGSIGTDNAGSVRNPASLCGIVGLKPTFGRISRYGVGVYGIPNDYVGPLTRTARDCALVMQVIAGRDDRDPYSAPVPVPNYIEALDGDLKETKVGIPKEHFWDYLDEEVESGVRSAISLLGELG